MILSQLTIVNPDGPTLTLGQWDFDGNGNAYGYSLAPQEFTPAPTVAIATKLPMFDKGIVASGLKDLRTFSIAGSCFAGSQDAVNQLFRELQIACDSSLTHSLSNIQFQPISTLPVMQLSGILTQVTPSISSPNEIGFTVDFTSGDPYAKSVNSTQVYGSGYVTAVVVGDDMVYPQIVITTSGAVTALNLTITGPLTTVLQLTGITGIGSGTHTITVTSNPGSENILVDGSSQRGAKVLSSTWPSMFTGSNSINPVVAGGSGSVSAYTVTWHEAWKL